MIPRRILSVLLTTLWMTELVTGQSDPCFAPATATSVATGVTNLKLMGLSQVACQTACRNALDTYDMVCFSCAHNAQTLECLLSGSESTIISHASRLPIGAKLTSPATAYFNNVCNEPQICVDEKRQCAYNRSPVCLQLANFYNKTTSMSGFPCKLWTNGRVGNNTKSCTNYDKSDGPWCYTDGGPRWEYCYPDCGPVCPAPPPASLGLTVVKQRSWNDGNLGEIPLAEDFTNPFNITVTIIAQQGTLFTLNISNWSPRALTELRCRVYFTLNTTVPVDVTIPGPVQDWTIYTYNAAIPGVRNSTDVKEIRVLFPFPWYSINFYGYGKRTGQDDSFTVPAGWQKRVYSRLLSDLRILFHLPKYRLWLLGYRMNQSDPVRHGRQSDFDRKADSFLVTLVEVTKGGAGAGTASLAFGDDTRPSRTWSKLAFHITDGSLQQYQNGWTNKGDYWTLEHELQHNHKWLDREFEMQSTQYFMQELSAQAYSSCILQWFKAPLERYEDTALLSAFQDPKDGLIYVLTGYTYRTIDLKNFIVVESPPSTTLPCAPPGMNCYQKSRPDCQTSYAYTGNKTIALSGRTCQKWNREPNNTCLNYDGWKEPWCWTIDTKGAWNTDTCYIDCGSIPDAEDPLYCVKADKTCAYKSIPLCQGRIPASAANLPDCDDLSASPCIDEGKGCIMEFSARCNEEIWGYKGQRFTSAEGMPCALSPQTGFQCFGDHFEYTGGYNRSSPYCYLKANQDERDMCFKICESPMLQTLRARRRAFIQQRWSEVWEPMKFSFRTASGGLFYVPYSYGAPLADEQVRKYDGTTGQYLSSQSLPWFLYPATNYYNPQFLQGFGAFIGSQYCELDEANEYLNGCDNLFGSKKWVDLGKFSSGSGDFDLVFRSDNYGFFFKGSEYIVYDLVQMKALPYYPKATKDFLYKVGIFGRTVAALA